MAKALYGHRPGDPALLAEVAHLRRRIRDLEAEVARLRSEAQAPALPALTDEELVELRTFAPSEPALT